MPLDGAAFARWEARFGAYAEGKTPCELVPIRLLADGSAVPTGGASVSFVHDERKVETIETQAGLLERSVLVVMVQSRLETGALYTHDGERWTVEACHPDRMGGVAWRYRAELVSHVR